jgi:hypothetical protein
MLAFVLGLTCMHRPAKVKFVSHKFDLTSNTEKMIQINYWKNCDRLYLVRDFIGSPLHGLLLQAKC